MTSAHNAPRGVGVLLRVLTGVAVAMVLVAVYAACLKLERLLFGLAIDDDQLTSGLSLPAAAFDGHSSGTLAVSAEPGLVNPITPYSVIGESFASTVRAIVIPFYWSELINAVLVLALAVVVLLLCLQLLRGGPFVTRITASLGAFALLLAVGSIASQLVRLGGFGGDTPSVAAAREAGVWQIFESQHNWASTDLQRPPYVPATGIALDLFPLGVAVLIAVIAAAFWLGHRMQRDTDGLV